jgi:hypothetical protein
VIDEPNSPIGLISYYDFLINPNGLVKDCNLDKPRLDPNDSDVDALNLITSWIVMLSLSIADSSLWV